MKVKRITSIWLAILLAGFQMNSFAQEEGDNYTITRTFLDESQTKAIDEVTFYNGLGFPIVELTKGVTPDGKDIVRGTSYDNRGRISYKSVPKTVSVTGSRDPYMLQLISMTSFGDRTAYSSFSYEASSQSRMLETRGPGDAWNGKSVRTEYLLSHNRDPRFSCKRYFADTGSGAPVCSGRYPDGALQMTMTIDEDNDTTMVFTSSRGEQVLCRQICNGEFLDTYYVNDALGRTRFILQPMYQQDSSIVHYAFEYRYDDSGKTVYSHTPDGAVSRFWYDKAGHLTFSQDSNQRTVSPEKFIFHFYDSMDREVINGECTAADTAGIASYIYCASYSESSGTVCNSGYTLNRVMPFSNGTLLKALFYDNYTHLNRAEFSDRSVFPSATNPAAGLPTGSITATLEQGVSQRLYSSFYYDEFGRLQTSVRTNLQGGYDKEQTQYSFTGKPVSKTISHTGNANLTEALNYTYDNADRLSSISHRTGSGATETILSCTYDELTRLSTETFGGGSQTKRTYGYNIRDQITSISSGKFNQNLYYASFGPNASISQPRYGGSPGAMIWTAGNSSGIHGYSFNYDNAGRLLNATYAYGNLQNQNIGLYSESIGTYDSNGNVCSVTRAGATTTLQHNGNRLSGSQYSYDANGNLTKDTGRGISAMTYNCLNLPSSVTLQDGNGINYIYSADGEKLKETVTSQGGTQNATEYSGNLIFKNGALQMMLTQTGYVTFSGSTPTYHYYQKDYLGNNRVVMRANGTVEQVNTYYPFGESISFLSSGADIQPFKLSGKPFETQTSSYDFGARYYAPAITSWTTPDPLAHKYPRLSPYVFCADNPVMYVDPSGMLNLINGQIEDGDTLLSITELINKHFNLNLSTNYVARVNHLDPNKELTIGEKIHIPGEDVTLYFNLESLYVIDNHYIVILPQLIWKGTSGRKDFQHKEYQSIKDMGPIPEGEYIVDPEYTQLFRYQSLKQRIIDYSKHGEWPGGRISWGSIRTWISPCEETNTFNRSGFSIHGGLTPGSAGCIDITNNNKAFQKWLHSYGKPVKLIVKYY